MAQVFNKIYIDVRTAIDDIITAVQNDSNSRFLDVYLLDGSTAINLTGHEVRIYGKKADGTEFYNNGGITNATAGRCQFELTSQALAVAQDLEVQIILFKNNVEVLSTQPFKIHVVKSLFSANAIESSNEYGALVVLYQNLYEAYDLMTTMVQNMGVAGEIAIGYGADTFWEILELMAHYLKVDLTDLLNTVLSEASVQGVIDRLGETADTGGTATAGTVYAKLNTLIGKHKSFKHLEASVPINQTDYTILSLTGAGDFYGLYGYLITNVKVIVDGVEFSAAGSPSGERGYKPSISNGLFCYFHSGTSATASNDYAVHSAPVMPFKNSLLIKVSSGANIATAKLSYALYE